MTMIIIMIIMVTNMMIIATMVEIIMMLTIKNGDCGENYHTIVKCSLCDSGSEPCPLLSITKG